MLHYAATSAKTLFDEMEDVSGVFYSSQAPMLSGSWSTRSAQSPGPPVQRNKWHIRTFIKDSLLLLIRMHAFCQEQAVGHRGSDGCGPEESHLG